MKKILSNVFMFESKTNVLLYINNGECFLIDSGRSSALKDEIEAYLLDNNLKLNCIINTHCHSDHILNDDLCNCKIIASELEKEIIENNLFQLDFLYGGRHPKFMDSCFVASKSFKVSSLEKIDNIDYIYFPGHSYNMIGVCIEDKVLYIGDALFSERDIGKIAYIYDVEKFLDSLNNLESYKDKIIVSSHLGVINNIDDLIKLNRLYVNDMIEMILDACSVKCTFDSIVEFICEKKNINLSVENYFLICSTIRSFISYLVDNDFLIFNFYNYNLYYEKK